jgi:aminoglycoside phosphotransferase (APT) family kinase protein
VPQATSAFGPAAALDPEPTLGFALTHVPGYLPGRPDVAITRLAGGSVNHSYRVSTPAGEYVLRLSPQTDAWLVTDRKVERELHARAAAEGIAPRIVHADEQDRWLITEFIEGRLWSAADFAAADSLALLAQTLRRLHGLQAPARGRFDLLSALGAYVQRIRPADARLQTYLEEAARAWPASGAPDRRATIVHHDLHASNVIETRCGLMLIDWECAAVSDPLLDVACVLSYYEPARSFASMFLERVGLPGVSAPQLQAAVWLFDLHTWLWYCERRQRRVPTQAELDTARGLSLRVARGPQRGR